VIWNNTLLAQSRVDKVVTMNTYTSNDVTFAKKAKELSAVFTSKLIIGMEHDVNNSLNASRLASRFTLLDELNVNEVWVWKNGDLFSQAWVDQLKAWATPVSPPRSNVGLGYLAVSVSCVLFGSFSVFIKQKKVQAVNMAPVVMQVYFAIAIFFTSWLTVAVHPFVFTPYGFAGGVIWSLASMLSFVAIRHAGLSVGQGVWSGATILTSFILGVAVAHEKVHRLPVAITALAVMIAGIAGIALTPARSSVSAEGDDEGPLEQHLAAGADGFSRIPDDERGVRAPSSSSAPASAARADPSGKTRGQIIFGIAVSVAVGVVNGFIMVPFVFNKVKAIVYLVSFSFGVCAATVFALAAWVVVTKSVPEFHVRTCALPCILSGALWNVGNASSVYATSYLGQSVGYSLTQLSLLIGGMWAVFFFKEITGTKSITQYFVSAAILLAGAILLGLFG
jgi:glucose uptake protein GlcU